MRSSCLQQQYLPGWKAMERKKLFLDWFAKELCIELVKERRKLPGHITCTKYVMDIFIENYREKYEGANCPTAQCQACKVAKNLSQCQICSQVVCIGHGSHRSIYRCAPCQESCNVRIVLKGGQKRCGFCPRSKDKTAKVYCCACAQFMCPIHERFPVTYFICFKCKGN